MTPVINQTLLICRSQSSGPPYLLDLVQPLFVGLKFGHEGLVFQPLAVQVPGLVVGHVLSCEHLLVDPQRQLHTNTGYQGVMVGSIRSYRRVGR